VTLIGFDIHEGNELFRSYVVSAKNTNMLGIINEESPDHPDILVCRDLRDPWPLFWQKFRRFG
jgi:hypothetical protein